MFRVVGWLLRNSLIVQMHTYVTLTFDCDDDDTDGQEKTVLPNPIDSIETFFPCPDDEDNPEFWANAFGDTLNSSSNATTGSNVQRPRADASEAEWSAFFGPVTTVRPRQRNARRRSPLTQQPPPPRRPDGGRTRAGGGWRRP